MRPLIIFLALICAATTAEAHRRHLHRPHVQRHQHAKLEHAPMTAYVMTKAKARTLGISDRSLLFDPAPQTTHEGFSKVAPWAGSLTW